MGKHSISQFIEEFYPQYWGYQSYPANKCVRIHKIDEEWGIFSNFAHTPITVNGVTFKSTEQLYQIMKFKDQEPIETIWRTNNKKMAMKWENESRRPDWGQILVDAMKFCLMLKYEQHQSFRTKLEESKGCFIVEDQSSFSKKQPDTWGVKLNGDEYVGPNLLGRLLMELRDNGKLEYKLPEDALDFIQMIPKD